MAFISKRCRWLSGFGRGHHPHGRAAGRQRAIRTCQGLVQLGSLDLEVWMDPLTIMMLGKIQYIYILYTYIRYYIYIYHIYIHNIYTLYIYTHHIYIYIHMHIIYSHYICYVCMYLFSVYIDKMWVLVYMSNMYIIDRGPKAQSWMLGLCNDALPTIMSALNCACALVCWKFGQPGSTWLCGGENGDKTW